MPSYKEKELLNLAARGDEAAFKKLFTACWPQVYGTSLHITRSPEQARDLSQDIFLKLWEKRSKLAEVDQLDAYLYVLSRNHITDHLRKKVFNAENVDFLLEYFSSDAVSVHDKMEYRELENLLSRAVEQLPDKVREVFKLSRHEGLSHPQIAEKLNISVFTSRTYITRAIQEIRAYLARHGDHTALLAILFTIQQIVARIVTSG